MRVADVMTTEVTSLCSDDTLTLNDLARTTASALWPDRALRADAIEATLAAVGEHPHNAHSHNRRRR